MKAKTVNTAKLTPEIRRMVNKIKKERVAISKHRDNLRSIYSDLYQLVESIDSGVEDLEDGVFYIEKALDEMSQYI